MTTSQNTASLNSVEGVARWVHHAIRKVDLESCGYTVKTLSMTLSVVCKRRLGAKPEFSVFGIHAGLGLARSYGRSHSIEIALDPAYRDPDSGLGTQMDNEACNELIGVFNSLKACLPARARPGPVEMTGLAGGVEIDVGFTVSGNFKLSVVAGGEAGKDASHRLKVTLGPESG